MRSVKQNLAKEPEGPMLSDFYWWMSDVHLGGEAADDIASAIENELEGDPNAEDWETTPHLHAATDEDLNSLLHVLEETHERIPEAHRLVREWIARRNEFKHRLAKESSDG